MTVAHFNFMGGTAAPFVPLSAKLVCLCHPAPNHPYCAKLVYQHRPAPRGLNWATKYDHYEAPCPKTWLKHRVFGLNAVMVAVLSRLWATMEAGFRLAVRPQALHTFCAVTLDLFMSHFHSFICRCWPLRQNNGKWLKVGEMFLSHREQIENRIISAWKVAVYWRWTSI